MRLISSNWNHFLAGQFVMWRHHRKYVVGQYVCGREGDQYYLLRIPRDHWPVMNGEWKKRAFHWFINVIKHYDWCFNCKCIYVIVNNSRMAHLLVVATVTHINNSQNKKNIGWPKSGIHYFVHTVEGKWTLVCI